MKAGRLHVCCLARGESDDQEQGFDVDQPNWGHSLTERMVRETFAKGTARSQDPGGHQIRAAAQDLPCDGPGM